MAESGDRTAIEDSIWYLTTKEVGNSTGENTELVFKMKDSNATCLSKITMFLDMKHNTDVPKLISSCLPSLLEQSHKSLKPPRFPVAVVWKDAHMMPSDLQCNLNVPIVACLPSCRCFFNSLKPRLFRSCAHCGFTGTKSLFLKCSTCFSIYYCSTKCQIMNSTVHSQHCKIFILAQSLKEELGKLPFSFTHSDQHGGTTDDQFTEPELASWMASLGIMNHGLWIRESPVCLNCSELPLYGELDVSVDPYVLPLEGLTLENDDVTPLSTPLDSWEKYFVWRGLDFTSPVAVLLQSVLTVYHIVQNSGRQHQSTLNLVIAAVDKEADYSLTFRELVLLMPRTKIHIYLVGPLISSRVCGKISSYHNVTVQLYFGTLHHFLALCEGYSIDLIICLNAGISAYSTWKDSIIKLKTLPIDTYITDYCLVSLHMSKTFIEMLNSSTDTSNMNSLENGFYSLGLEHSVNGQAKMKGVGSCSYATLSDPVINPFRSPVRKYNESVNLPWFSNAFICKLLYR